MIGRMTIDWPLRATNHPRNVFEPELVPYATKADREHDPGNPWTLEAPELPEVTIDKIMEWRTPVAPWKSKLPAPTMTLSMPRIRAAAEYLESERARRVAEGLRNAWPYRETTAVRKIVVLPDGIEIRDIPPQVLYDHHRQMCGPVSALEMVIHDAAVRNAAAAMQPLADVLAARRLPWWRRAWKWLGETTPMMPGFWGHA